MKLENFQRKKLFHSLPELKNFEQKSNLIQNRSEFLSELFSPISDRSNMDMRTSLAGGPFPDHGSPFIKSSLADSYALKFLVQKISLSPWLGSPHAHPTTFATPVRTGKREEKGKK